MRKLFVVVGLTAMASLLLWVQASEPAASPEPLISITLDDVPVTAVLRMFSRITGMNFLYNPRDFDKTKRVTVNLVNEPSRPALQSILAAQGFVLLVEPGGHNVYSITKTDNPETAVRIQYASAAVSLADTVLADISSNNVVVAKAHLQAFADSNRQILKAFDESRKKTQKGSANDTSEPNVAPAPQVQH